MEALLLVTKFYIFRVLNVSSEISASDSPVAINHKHRDRFRDFSRIREKIFAFPHRKNQFRQSRYFYIHTRTRVTSNKMTFTKEN
jgi:hypothetical protein